MARIKKKHRDESNYQEMKHRHRNPNIPKLIYKFLVANNKEFEDKCCCCDQEKHHDNVVDSISRTNGKSTGYKVRRKRHKDSDRISKLHNAKKCSISKDLPISYLQKYVDSEDTRKGKKYMKKALNFGVESGYLIPFDPTYRILRVSSNLLKSNLRRDKISTCDMIVSNNCNTPTRLENIQEQKRRQRRRERRRRGQRSRSSLRMRRKSRRRRRSSRSRSRRREKYSSPQNPEEVAEDEADDYEMDENDLKSNIHTDDIEREPKSARPDVKQSTKNEEVDSDPIEFIH